MDENKIVFIYRTICVYLMLGLIFIGAMFDYISSGEYFIGLLLCILIILKLEEIYERSKINKVNTVTRILINELKIHDEQTRRKRKRN